MESNNNNNNSNNNNNNDFNPSEIDQINENEIAEIEEIDKNLILDEDETNNNNNNNNNNNDMMNIDEENPQEELEEENFQKEYPSFTSPGEIYSIAFHPPSNTLIIGDGEDTTTFFNLSSKTIISQSKYSNTDSINFLKFSIDLSLLISTSVDGSISIFSYDSTSKNFILKNTITDNDKEITWLAIHPKGPAFSFGNINGEVYVYSMKKITENFGFYNHIGSTSCGDFTNDGKILISSGEDCSVRIYNLKDKILKETISGKKFVKNGIISMDVCKNKPILVVGTVNDEISIVNYEKGNVLFYNQFSNEGNSIENICFCNENSYIIFSDSKNNVNIFEINSFQIRAKIVLDEENITKFVKSNLNSFEVFCGGSNGNLYVIDVRGNGKIICKEKCHKDVIMDFVVTENEKFVITSSLDKTINLVKIVEIN